MNLASFAVVFSHLMEFKCYKCCTFNTFCKENAVMYFINVQHKRVHSSELGWVARTVHAINRTR
jgi:hypothetical protein